MIIDILAGVIITTLAGTQGYIMKKLSEKPSRQEVYKTIDTKLESTKVIERELKEDVKRLETKIDRLIELQLK